MRTASLQSYRKTSLTVCRMDAYLFPIPIGMSRLEHKFSRHIIILGYIVKRWNLAPHRRKQIRNFIVIQKDSLIYNIFHRTALGRGIGLCTSGQSQDQNQHYGDKTVFEFAAYFFHSVIDKNQDCSPLRMRSHRIITFSLCNMTTGEHLYCAPLSRLLLQASAMCAFAETSCQPSAWAASSCTINA